VEWLFAVGLQVLVPRSLVLFESFDTVKSTGSREVAIRQDLPGGGYTVVNEHIRDYAGPNPRIQKLFNYGLSRLESLCLSVMWQPDFTQVRKEKQFVDILIDRLEVIRESVREKKPIWTRLPEPKGRVVVEAEVTDSVNWEFRVGMVLRADTPLFFRDSHFLPVDRSPEGGIEGAFVLLRVLVLVHQPSLFFQLEGA